MAEAFLNALGGDRFEAKSGGIEAGKLNPFVIASMQEIGIDISAQRAKKANDFLEAGERFDYVITVCDETNAERCPIFPGGAKRLHWGVPDPSSFSGSDDEKMQLTATVRDAIRLRIEQFSSAESVQE